MLNYRYYYLKFTAISSCALFNYLILRLNQKCQLKMLAEIKKALKPEGKVYSNTDARQTLNDSGAGLGDLLRPSAHRSSSSHQERSASARGPVQIRRRLQAQSNEITGSQTGAKMITLSDYLMGLPLTEWRAAKNSSKRPLHPPKRDASPTRPC